jgi:Glycosyl transferase family 11
MIVSLTGGLGNQLFMYAFGKSLSLRRNEPVQFHWQKATRDYVLDAYSMKIDLVKSRGTEHIYDEPAYQFVPEALNQPPGTYFRGYWQTERYFKEYEDTIREEITLKEKPSEKVEETAKNLCAGNSVFIHVRRGDYLNPGTKEYHGVPLEDYYKRAIEHVKSRVENPEFFVFSDDTDWCAQNMPGTVVSGFNQCEDLHLMSYCKHGILANSTFGWWAAWLGNAGVVVAPKNWFVRNDICTQDLIPDRWSTL